MRRRKKKEDEKEMDGWRMKWRRRRKGRNSDEVGEEGGVLVRKRKMKKTE